MIHALLSNTFREKYTQSQQNHSTRIHAASPISVIIGQYDLLPEGRLTLDLEVKRVVPPLVQGRVTLGHLGPESHLEEVALLGGGTLAGLEVVPVGAAHGEEGDRRVDGLAVEVVDAAVTATACEVTSRIITSEIV